MSSTDRQLVRALGRVGETFFRNFSQLRDSQRLAIEPIFSGQNVLLACPTASGKTEAIFAPLIARILATSAQVGAGTHLLAIAPTRALVNDLYARLNPLMEELRLSCGRQTSDHRLGKQAPFLLITTPESFDSMLVRKNRFDQGGKLVGHALASVQAVFIDEAHLFDNSTRGDQLVWLLERLRRVKRSLEGPDLAGDIQLCGASATVSLPEGLANRLLGQGAQVLAVPGGRELLIFDHRDCGTWTTLGCNVAVADVCKFIPLTNGRKDHESVANAIWQAMSGETGKTVRKVLVFVPSRRDCDELSTFLTAYLRPRRVLSVYAHHGSLDKRIREEAEESFASNRDAVLVATSTLEVGVDIGDVDAVALIGPPSDTNALLQRIGRSGRREGVTRIVATAKSEVDRYALASMLVAARDGIFDPLPYGRRWSVCVQQISSFIKQGPTNGRRTKDIVELAETVWPGEGGTKAKLVIDQLRDDGLVVVSADGRVSLGETWAEAWDGMGMHGNIDNGSFGTPVIDAVTGETVAHIPMGSTFADQIAIGGANWRVVQSAGEVTLEPLKTGSTREAIRYGARKGPVGRAFARHVAIGMGLSDQDVVVLNFLGGSYVFHFGGSAFEIMLATMVSGLERLSGLGGIALHGSLTNEDLQNEAAIELLATTARQRMDGMTGMFALGPFHKMLPAELQVETILKLFSPNDFCDWVRSRKVVTTTEGDAMFDFLVSVFAEADAGR